MISKVAIPRLDSVTTILKLFVTELRVTHTSIVYLSSQGEKTQTCQCKRV